MLAKNKTGYQLLEYLPIQENEIDKYENVTSAGVVVKVKDRYLLGYNNWRLQWELPVGRIEENELPKEAALRELEEETHQIVKDIKFKGLFKKIRPNGQIIYSALYFIELNRIIPFVKQDNDENDEIILWNLKDDIGYVDEIDAKIIELIQ